jgi:hypothetical protein
VPVPAEDTKHVLELDVTDAKLPEPGTAGAAVGDPQPRLPG